jgi:seryl-tRNA synthetase
LNIKRNERASLTARIASASPSGQDDDKAKALEDAKTVKETISDLEFRLAQLDELLLRLALPIPNDSHPLSPVGSSASILSTRGPPPTAASNARDHVTIGRALDLIDFEAGALATGSSWYYLTHEGALLEMALINYALSVAIEHGFTPVTVPDVVRAEVAAGCGFNPRDNAGSQTYHVTTNECTAGVDVNPRLVLAGTAEIPLAALFANKILSSPSQPSKVVGVGRAFRAEAGARGADTRGLYRVHQFTKVELFAVTHEDNSDDMMEEIRTLQVRIFEGLGIPFRYVVRLISVTSSPSIPIESSKCQPKSSARAHTASMTWKLGCQAAVNGEKYPQPRIARIINLAGCTSVTATPRHLNLFQKSSQRHLRIP